MRIAIVVDPTLPLGLLANTVATLSIGLGAARPVFGNTALTDAAGRQIMNSADRPVPILQAPGDALSTLLLKALPAPDHAIVVAFPRFARVLHTFADYRDEFPNRDLGNEPIDGMAIAGEDKWVRSLTGNLNSCAEAVK